MADDKRLFARPFRASEGAQSLFGGRTLVEPPELREVSIFEGRYSTGDVAIVCGVDSSTLAKLIRRHGPMPDTRPRPPLPGKSAQWNLMDAICFRLATTLIDLGLPPANVFWVLRDREVGFSTRIIIGKLLTDRNAIPALVAVHAGGNPARPKDQLSFIFLTDDTTAGQLWAQAGLHHQRTLRLLNLNDVIDHVLFATGVEVVARDLPPGKAKS